MKLEKEENRKIQAYLDLSMRMTLEHQKGKWKYVDAEDFFNELKRRKGTPHSQGEDTRTDGRGLSQMSLPLNPDGTAKTTKEEEKAEPSAT
jgi:hypothetical protein